MKNRPCFLFAFIAASCGAQIAFAGASFGKWVRPTEYKFENDVATDVADVLGERLGNGKICLWYHYKNGRLVSTERDTDQDGKPDLRTTVTPGPDALPPSMVVAFIGGRYRIVPAQLGQVQGEVKMEKLINGVWTGTFEDHWVIKMNSSGAPIAEDTKIRCVDGVLREAWYHHGDHYTKEDGKIARTEKSDKDGKIYGIVERVDSRHGFYTLMNKTPQRRFTDVDGIYVKTEQLVVGKWTGDFEDITRTDKDVVTDRLLYRNGVMVESQQYKIRDGEPWLFARYMLYADGSSLHEYSRNLKEFDWRDIQDKDGNRTVEMKEDGVWKKDFTIKSPASETTYKNGRAVKIEYPQPVPQLGKVLALPTPDTEEWGDGKSIFVWRKYEVVQGKRTRLLYEARDFDSDGKPDMIADLVKLTITQPDYPAGPGK